MAGTTIGEVKSDAIEPEDGMVIAQDTVFRPGVYVLPRGIQVAADGVAINGMGAKLIGAGNGRGVSISGRTGVTIRNLELSGYYHGVYARECQRLTIDQCRISNTVELPANSVFLDIWRPAEAAYGGGLFLWQVTDSHVGNNDLQHQMNGLLAYSCRELVVRNNIANYCSGFGFYLHQTCDSLFADNFADFCCRYQPRDEGIGHMGADAAGFVIVYQSCGNTFRGNSARLGGDGFFLAGLAPDGIHAGCDDNLFESNDGSYSPNIAFEATFSRGNVYRDNRANFCNYGFWLGYSRENLLEQNQIWRNRQAGIAVENGVGMRLQRNDVRRNGHGVLLWTRFVDSFATSVPQNDTSRDWIIEDNQFLGNGKGIRIAADQDHGIRPLPPGHRATPRPDGHTIRGNTFQESRIGVELEGTTGTLLQENRFDNNLLADVVGNRNEE